MSVIFSQTLRISTIALLLALFVLQPVSADSSGSFTRQDAIREAQKRNGGGKVLGVTERNNNGSRTFEVKLIDNGKVRIFTIRGR